MGKKIFKCTVCGAYTLRTDKCPKCGGIVRPAHPPRFSPLDKYGKYRRMIKMRSLKMNTSKINEN
mgnify:CR=1 FL=1